MDSPWLKVALRAPVCALATWLAWRGLGPVGLVVTAPVWGIALARPLIDIGAGSAGSLRALALRDVEGEFYAFQGRWIHVHEDEDGRWLRAAHVRRVVPGWPDDGVLLRLHPDGCRRLGRVAALYVGTAAVLAVLDRAQAARTLKFKLWIERELVLPLRKRRERDGLA